MFDRTYYATHPDMMAGASNEELRDRYLIQNLFRKGACVLNYTHAERFVIGGVLVESDPVQLPRQQAPATSKNKPFLERRELGIVNVGSTEGAVTVDGERFVLANKECLYVTKGAEEIEFSGPGARFYLASCPAHQAFATRKLALSDGNTLDRGSHAAANERTIHQLVIPGVCDSAQLVMGVTVLKEGNVWNTMPPHVHDRRTEIYFYFELADPEGDRVIHFMGEREPARHIIMANEEAVISPPWSIHMGVGTKAYAFIWAMAGENQDYTDMDTLGAG